MLSPRLSVRLLAVPLAALGLITALHGPLRAAEAPRVKIENFTFTPQNSRGQGGHDGDIRE